MLVLLTGLHTPFCDLLIDCDSQVVIFTGVCTESLILVLSGLGAQSGPFCPFHLLI